MQMVLVGTVPTVGLPLTQGQVSYEGGELRIGNHPIMPGSSLMHCTTAMMAAAALTCKELALDPPYGVTAGCIGDFSGSRLLYTFLAERADGLNADLLVLHYIVPHSLLIKNAVNAIMGWKKRPILIGDAGGMYAVKVGGLAPQFDLFTPDPGELAFLADVDALHPAYVRHFISEVDTTDIPRLIRQAYEHKDAAKTLLVKGATDYIARDSEILATVNEPCIPAMEAIGGTGDTITGIVAGLICGGIDIVQASIQTARINRLAGFLCKPTPATQIGEIVQHIPEALNKVLAKA